MRQFLLNTRSLLSKLLNTFPLGGGGISSLFLDTFTDTNGTNLNAHTPEQGGPWTYDVGEVWEIQNNAAHHISGVSPAPFYAANAMVDVSTADVVISTPMTTGPSKVGSDAIIAGVSTRYTDVDNKVLAYCVVSDLIAFNTWFLRKTVAGVATTISESTGQSIAVNTEYDLNLSVNGDDYEFRIDGVLKASGTDAFNNTVTNHGLFRQGIGGSIADSGSFWSSMEIT